MPPHAAEVVGVRRDVDPLGIDRRRAAPVPPVVPVHQRQRRGASSSHTYFQMKPSQRIPSLRIACTLPGACPPVFVRTKSRVPSEASANEVASAAGVGGSAALLVLGRPRRR